VLLGFLPADVDKSLVSTASDVLYIIDVLNGIVGDLNDLASCDVDRSGACVASDILRVIDLLNGSATTRAWLNVGLGEPPCDVDAECDDQDICTNDFCRFGVCESEVVDCSVEECDPSCLVDADLCENAAPLNREGIFNFDNTNATLDGPGHALCVAPANQNNFLDNMNADVWGCWTAPCTGTVFIDTCGLTTIDTKIAVYEGCECPVSDATVRDCNDDTCELQSRVTTDVQEGQQYLVRIGVFPGEPGGIGRFSVTCGLETCNSATDPCTAPGEGSGCSDLDCCETVCALDSFCCDPVSGSWDQTCVDQAGGLCSEGGFAVCGSPGSGNCNDTAGTGSPGCEQQECCNTVCALDPFCCLTVWDDVCAQEEAQFCRSACGPGAGDCFMANGTAGCESPDCCREVCIRDPICCGALDFGVPGTWDEICVQEAQMFCTP
jgi:hypothetical protein